MTDIGDRDDGLREELEGPDEAAYATQAAGAGGQPARDADEARASHEDRDDVDADETAAGVTGTGGAPPGAVAPPPGEHWPDPMGWDDDARDLERRTR